MRNMPPGFGNRPGDLEYFDYEDLLDEIEREVREEYWNGNWSKSGCTVTVHTSMYRGTE